MLERELMGLFFDKTVEALKGAAEDDFSALVNAMTGLVLYPKADDLSVLARSASKAALSFFSCSVSCLSSL